VNLFCLIGVSYLNQSIILQATTDSTEGR